jgi:hypothetical protein
MWHVQGAEKQKDQRKLYERNAKSWPCQWSTDTNSGNLYSYKINKVSY